MQNTVIQKAFHPYWNGVFVLKSDTDILKKFLFYLI